MEITRPDNKIKGKLLLPKPTPAATTWTIEKAGQSKLKFYTVMMYKLLLITLLFHGLVKVQSARLDLRLAECLTSQTALLLTYFSFSTRCKNYAVACLSRFSHFTAQPSSPRPVNMMSFINP